MHGSINESVALQILQCLGEHLFTDATDHATQLTKAETRLAQQGGQNDNAPAAGQVLQYWPGWALGGKDITSFKTVTETTPGMLNLGAHTLTFWFVLTKS